MPIKTQQTEELTELYKNAINDRIKFLSQPTNQVSDEEQDEKSNK